MIQSSYYWDENKNLLNQEKHGISFQDARDSIFEGKNILATNVAYNKSEARYAMIGKHEGKYYVGIFTTTPLGIRIISVRRARYEEENQAREKGL